MNETQGMDKKSNLTMVQTDLSHPNFQNDTHNEDLRMQAERIFDKKSQLDQQQQELCTEENVEVLKALLHQQRKDARDTKKLL